MTEDEAREAVASGFNVPRETMGRLDRFVGLLRAANAQQNLVSSSSLEAVWARHILDSAQLLRFRPSPGCSWLDLGTGAGFPGLVVAALHQGPITMLEERKLRVDFLHQAALVLGIKDGTAIVQTKVERAAEAPFDVISARAFAPLDRLLQYGERFSTNETIWILPKGRNAHAELEAARSSWQGDFRIEHSLTDNEAGIIVAKGVQRKRR